MIARPSIESQRERLRAEQQQQTVVLIRSGIAQKAMAACGDIDWFQPPTSSDRLAESMPVVMLDDGQPGTEYFYVHFRGQSSDGKAIGQEVTVGEARYSSDGTAELMPYHTAPYFSLPDVQVVRDLAWELRGLRTTALPDLSDNLLDIKEPDQ